MTNAKAQRWKKEENKRLRGEGDNSKFIDLRFERWQVEGFTKRGPNNQHSFQELATYGRY